MNINLTNKLLIELHNNSIAYCHWKSIEHLDAALTGDTDLDILVDINDKSKVEKIFNDIGFKLYKAPWFKSYDAICDYIGIDHLSNKIIHVHTHFKLIVGESGIKNHHLKHEKNILHNRIYDKKFETYIITPEYEIFLLLVRIGLKFGTNKLWNTQSSDSEVKNFIVEFLWLKKKVVKNDVEKLFNITNKDFSILLNDIWDYNLNNKNVVKLSKSIKYLFQEDRRFKKSYHIVKSSRKFSFQIGRIIRKIGFAYRAKKRVRKGMGFIIAIVGSDGSGKSTQINTLTKILNNKIDVESLYMGSNKGSRSKLRKCIENIDANVNKSRNQKKTSIQRFVTMILAFSVAREKKRKIKKASNYKKAGVFVICDRYPQTETFGPNDGLLLHKKYFVTKNIFIKKLLKYELKCYTSTESQSPDIIFKLIVNPQTLSQRRDMSLQDVVKKQNGIKSLRINKYSKVLEVDANKTINEVTSFILKHINLDYFQRNNE